MRKTLPLIAVTVLLGLTACSGDDGGTEPTAGGGGDGGTLTIAVSQTPISWNPRDAAYGAGDRQYLAAVYDTLVLLDENAEPTPGIATEWEWDDTNTLLTLSLREGVTFTDGEPLDAAAVVTNLENTRSGSGEGSAALAGITNLEATDDLTVEITIGAPDPTLLPKLGLTPGLLASPASVATGSAATDPVGSGPYVLTTQGTTQGSRYSFTRNPDHWNSDAFPYDKVTYIVLTDQTARENAVRAGEVDAAEVNPTNAGSLESAGLSVSLTGSGDIEGLFLFDRGGTLCPPLGDVRVRQAMNYAFDRDTLVEQLTAGYGIVTNQIFSPSSATFDDALLDVYPYDPDRARELLAEAGYADGFTCQTPDWSGFNPQAQAAMDQYLGAVGIDLTSVGIAPTELMGRLNDGSYPLTYFRIASHRPWDTLNTLVAPEAIWNPLDYADPTVDALLAQIRETTGDEQEAALAELNTFLVEEAWFVPWDEPQTAYATSPDVVTTQQVFSSVPPLRGFKPAN